MSTDYFISDGLNEREMAEDAERYRREFDIALSSTVDIVDVIEFKLCKIDPEFILVIVRDDQISQKASALPKEHKIIVRESVYSAACEGDSDARFTLAHELGHYLLHKHISGPLNGEFDRRKYTSQFEGLNALERTEPQADIFARHFLVSMKTAYRYKDDPKKLAEITGIPLPRAIKAIMVSKRQEMIALRQERQRL